MFFTVRYIARQVPIGASWYLKLQKWCVYNNINALDKSTLEQICHKYCCIPLFQIFIVSSLKIGRRVYKLYLVLYNNTYTVCTMYIICSYYVSSSTEISHKDTGIATE